MRRTDRANERKTVVVTVRLDEAQERVVEEVVGLYGINRSSVLRMMIRFYERYAKIPLTDRQTQR